ncbi:unnamed protein product, partial [Laminaria digitata]
QECFSKSVTEAIERACYEMDKECLEVQWKTLQCQRGLETVDESGVEEKSGGAASDVLPADSRPRESLLPSLPDADSERRTSGGLAGTAAVKCGGATAAVAVVTKVGEARIIYTGNV